MHIKCSFPHDIAGRLLIANATEAIQLDVPPEPLPPVCEHSMAVYLSTEQQKLMGEFAATHGISVRETVETLAYGLYQHRRRGQSVPDAAVPVSEVERNRAHLLSEIKEGLALGQIVLAEGSTGIGKSRILSQTAAHIMDTAPAHRVWVAAPTISVLAHLAQEFKVAEPGLAPTILLGRRNFVSVRRLRLLVDELAAAGDPDLPGCRERVENWLSAGAPPTTDFALRLATILPGLSHLYDDLAKMAPVLAQPMVALEDADEDEPAADCVSRMHEASAGSRLVLCTHAMLFSKVRFIKKGSPLPFTHLLVDEVHELEESVAAQCSHELSLLRLRTWFRKNRLALSPKACEALTELMGSLAGGNLRSGYHLGTEATRGIMAALAPLRDIIRSARKVDEREKMEWLVALSGIVNPKGGRMGVSFSPVRRYPSVYCGPVSVTGLLGGVWAGTKAAVGVSGTLFLPTFTGGLSSGYMSAKLGVPPGRVRSVGPVACSWVQSSVQFFRPDASAVPLLCYPSKLDLSQDPSDDQEPENLALEAYASWADAAANAILRASGDAAGGTLVLCTAFRDIRELRARLNLSLGERLLSHEKGLSTSQQKDTFVSLRARGLRPVWLASGAAWTGLDLRDQLVPPAQDTLLTDVVILRAPIGLCRTSTHRSRRQNIGYIAELHEASIRARQGIGRLVRSEGLLHRRLWMLDGRLWSPAHKQFRTLTALFSGYRNVREFSLQPERAREAAGR